MRTPVPEIMLVTWRWTDSPAQPMIKLKAGSFRHGGISAAAKSLEPVVTSNKPLRMPSIVLSFIPRGETIGEIIPAR
ncbi:MAG: hypothetical protein ACOX4M_07240 [Acetivibrionales bacterium]